MRAVLIVAVGCAGPPTFSDADVALLTSMAQPPGPPPSPTNRVADDEQAAELGQLLFFSTALSVDGSVACSTCHIPEHGFADPEALSTGVTLTARHAPTLLNVGYQRWLYWDGRRDSLWAQALAPLEADGEHGASRVGVLHAVAEDPSLREAYVAVFGSLPDRSGWPEAARPIPEDPERPEHVAWETLGSETQDAINHAYANVGKSLAAYQRRLVTEPAPFDRFAVALGDGDVEAADEALSGSAQRGAQLFVGRAGCVQCHNGPLLTDLSFHNIGLGPREWLDSEDRGRWDGLQPVLDDPFNGVGAYSDDPQGPAALKLATATRFDEFLGAFKTPSLRNVAETGPWMHGGNLTSLDDVVRHYDDVLELPLHGHREEVLLALGLSGGERRDLVAFLESLTAPLLEPRWAAPPAR